MSPHRPHTLQESVRDTPPTAPAGAFLGLAIVIATIVGMLVAGALASPNPPVPSTIAGETEAADQRAEPVASRGAKAPRGTPEALDLLTRMRAALGGKALDRIEGVRASMLVRRGERDENPVEIVVASRPERTGRPFAAVIRQAGGGRGASEIGFDGTHGWMSDGTGGFMPLDADQALAMLSGADLQALARDLPSRFDRFDLDPPGEFRGKRVLSLRAVSDEDPPGDFTRVHVDPSTALPLAIESFEADANRPFNVAIFDRWERLDEARVFRRMTSERGGAITIIDFETIAYDPIPGEAIASPLDRDAAADTDG